MPTDKPSLELIQWLSPAFPTGAFAFSHGIEAAIADGWITDADSLGAWLRDCLEHGSGRSDAIWIRLAHAADDPSDIDMQVRAFALSAERLREAERQGAAFVATVNAVWNLHLPPLLLPVAIGHAVHVARFDIDMAVALYLQSFVSNLTLAALRLCPIGQTAGQRVIRDAQQVCRDIADDTRNATLSDISGSAFLSDIAAMRHETLQPRLFQS